MRRPADSTTIETEIWLIDDGHAEPVPDRLAVEAPLEIRLGQGGESRSLAVTMRTPGADAELAAGFLYGEGVVRRPEDFAAFTARRAPGAEGSVLVVRLAAGVEPQLASLERHFYTTSACGLCGKAGLDALLLGREPQIPAGPVLAPALLAGLPDKLRARQATFDSTGGLHAAALFDRQGELLAAREDVGRHNALDKLIGWALLQGRLPLHEHLVLVSGRASYELVQKCLMAEVPLLAAVSAPSSAAVAMARRHGMTLVGFLRGRRMNVYSGAERLGCPLPLPR